MQRILAIIAVFLTTSPALAQAPPKPENVARLAELVSKSQGPYRKIGNGIWETSYKGKNLSLVRIRIATAGDGIFFIVPLLPRNTLTLSPEFLLKVVEFNANYDYVKLALEAKSLDLRLDAYATIDVATFNALESQTALAADAAYGLLNESPSR